MWFYQPFPVTTATPDEPTTHQGSIQILGQCKNIGNNAAIIANNMYHNITFLVGLDSRIIVQEHGNRYFVCNFRLRKF